ncbi:MAG: DUF6427 family protein [Bacteroidia bacterium]|nr:DUF6427 family protein [Bacteroidia bacterium]
MPFLHVIPIDLNINAPLAQFVFSWVTTFEDYYLFSAISATILIVLQAWMVNHLVIKHTILNKDSFLPALLFVLLNSFYPQQMFLSPQLIANLFIILMFQRLCNLYESEKPLYIVLDSGLYLGLAVLFNYDTLVYLPFILISVILMTYFNIRFILASIFGLLLPIYLLGVMFFMMDNLNDLKIIIQNSLNRNYLNSISINWNKIIPWFLIGFIVFVSGISLQINYFKNKVKTRRILFTLVLYIIISILLALIEDHNIVFAICYLSVPICIVMANYFMSKKHVILKEIFFFSLVIAAVIYQYFI